MEKKIYHGSKDIVKKPLYGYGKKTNDYGLGFYCTESIDLAKEWAVDFDRNGYCNCYTLEMDGLKILNLNSKQYNILHWLTILLQNRTFTVNTPLAQEAKQYLIDNFSIDYRSYDVIIGYRADDSYFSFSQDFINGSISYQQLTKAMYLGNLGEQIVLISKKAFDQIKFVEVIDAEKEIYYPSKKQRDEKARTDYFDTRKMKRNKNDLYIVDILDEEIKSDDKRLQ